MGWPRKLTLQQVEEIRLSKEPERILASKYNVYKSNIGKIRRFEIYKVSKNGERS